MVRDPESVPAVSPGAGKAAPYEWVDDVPGIDDLAEQGLTVAPDARGAMAVAVSNAVRRDLAHCKDEIVESLPAECRRGVVCREQGLHVAHGLAVELPHRDGADGFSERVVERSDDRVEARAVPVGSQLGDPG